MTGVDDALHAVPAGRQQRQQQALFPCRGARLITGFPLERLVRLRRQHPVGGAVRSMAPGGATYRSSIRDVVTAHFEILGVGTAEGV